jgi:hypothetical protein
MTIERITAGELANIAANTPEYEATWVGYGRLRNFRLKKIGPPSNRFFLVYADRSGRTVAWPPEQVLEIEKD